MIRSLSARAWAYRHSFTGPHFVNAVLAATGHPTIDRAGYERLRAELLADDAMAVQFNRHLPRLNQIAPHKKMVDWADRCRRVAAQIDIFYVLLRVLRPAVVVETGVAAGSMTSFLLAALHQNKHGHLYSFDLPAEAGKASMDWSVKNEAEIGFLIPDAYRDRWSLTLEDATYALPREFAGKAIDCFFHDSDHTFNHMMFEYAFAEKHLSPQGWIVSDDISQNNAFRRYFEGRAKMFLREGNANIGVAVPKPPPTK